MTHQRLLGLFAASCFVLLGAAGSAKAQIVVAHPIAVGTVASDLGNLFVYSDSSVAVGRLGAELLDGFVEFDIRNLPASGAGDLTFQVLSGEGATGFFSINLYLYAGDGTITAQDFEGPINNQIGGFSGGENGHTFDFGSYAYVQAQWGGYSFMGIRFQGARDQLGGPLPFLLRTLGGFALTIDPSVPLPPQPPPVHVIPEPQTYVLLLAGAVTVGAVAKRRRSRSSQN